MEALFARKNALTKNVVNAHAEAVSALKSFGFNKSISLITMKMKNSSGDLTDELNAEDDALNAIIDAAERSMRPLCASVQAILLLSTIDFLKKRALRARPVNVHLLVDQLNATLTEQSCFIALVNYLHEFSGLRSKTGSEYRLFTFASWPRRSNPTARSSPTSPR